MTREVSLTCGPFHSRPVRSSGRGYGLRHGIGRRTAAQTGMGWVSVRGTEKRNCCTTGLPELVGSGESVRDASRGNHFGKSGTTGRALPSGIGEGKPFAAGGLIVGC